MNTASSPWRREFPQVAVMRLRALLESDLAEEDRRAASAKLGEALLAAGETEEALEVLEDPALQALPATRFCRAQALAALERWTEALPLYQQVAAEAASPFRSRAILGQAEALRALERPDEALRVFALLFSDPQWKDRAELRSIELLLEKRDTAGARRILDRSKPISLRTKKRNASSRAGWRRN